MLSVLMETLPGSVTSVNDRIAARVRSLRAERGLTLDGLAASSGVSRSALSLIERGESSPTAIVLDRLAAGLGVPLASLFGPSTLTQPSPLSRRSEQVVWRDPASGYVRRAISPDGVGSPISIVEISFPPKARVAFETGARDRPPAQQVWLLDGALEVRLGEDRFRLEKGDCLAMRLDRPTIFHNPTDKPARYAVVVTDPRAGR